MPGEPLLGPGLLLGAARRRSAALSPSGVRLFSFARFALAAFMEERSARESTLFAPSYICDVAVDGVRADGRRVRFYPVTESLLPDWDWLTANPPDHGDAFLTVHYFGFANDIEVAIEFCTRHGVTLVEDCAHSFLTRHDGRLIGTFGDAGFYSYRKILPVPDGAGLVVRGKRGDGSEEIAVGPTRWADVARGIAKTAIYRSGRTAAAWRRVRGRTPGALGATRADAADRRISALSLRLIQALAPEHATIVQRRRDNYRLLLNGLAAFPEAVPVRGELGEGTCPYVFPIRVKDRKRLIDRLWRAGVPAHPWPELPREVSGSPDFKQANQAADEVMLLPVHQGLGAGHMDRIVEAYRGARAG